MGAVRVLPRRLVLGASSGASRTSPTSPTSPTSAPGSEEEAEEAVVLVAADAAGLVRRDHSLHLGEVGL